MTDPADPNRRRKHHSRQRPTIDLKARVITEGAPPAPAGDDATAIPGEGPPGSASSEVPPIEAAADRTIVESTGPTPGFPRAETFDAGAGLPPHRDAVDPTAPVEDEDFRPQAGPAAPASEPVSRAQEPLSADRPARRAPAFAALAGAALLGGVVGAGAIYGLTAGLGRSQPPPAPPDPRLTEIEQRLASLPRADLFQAIENRIRALEGGRADLAREIGAVRSLAERAAARAEEAAGRPPAAAQPGSPAAGPTVDPAALAALEDRLAALEAQARGPAASADPASQLAALEAKSRADAQAAADAVQALEKRVAEAAQALERRLAEGDGRVAALTQRLADWNPQAFRAGLRVVLANRLLEALREGAAFAPVLASLRRFDIAPARIQALEPLAASGAPTAAALAQGFRDLSEKIIREGRGEADGIGEKILRMGSRIASIRPVDDPGTGSVPGLVARIEDALARGAIADAAAAWDALPEPSRRVSEAWGRELKARVAAERAARDIAAEAIAALEPPSR